MAFDQYGDIRFEDEKARLDNFAIQLMNIPTARSAILAFAGNPTYRGEAHYRLRRAKNYLVRVRDIAPERIITIDSGFRTDFMIFLWVVPPGVTLPSLDEGNLRSSQISFTKRHPSTQRPRSAKRKQVKGRK